MDTSQSPEKDGERKVDAMFRRMGMGLSVVGVIVFSVGLAACMQCSCTIPRASCVLVFASGITMFAAGLYIWYSGKKRD